MRIAGPRVRYRLLTLFLVFTALVVALGWHSRRIHEIQRSIGMIESFGGRVWFEYECDDSGTITFGPVDQPWYARLIAKLGKERFYPVSCIDLRGTQVEDVDCEGAESEDEVESGGEDIDGGSDGPVAGVEDGGELEGSGVHWGESGRLRHVKTLRA